MQSLKAKCFLLASTLRKHKKKTVFLVGCSVYFANLAKRKKQDWDILADYSNEALTYGKQKIRPEEKPRRLTVLLNPLANSSKVRRLFETNALPLFHLAGLEVNVIRNESADQLVDIASAINESEADALYIVGGDGTLSRVLAGIYSTGNNNSNKSPPALPVGIFPGGYSNKSLALLVPDIFGYENRQNIAWFCESAMAVIRDVRKPVPVMRVESVDDQSTLFTLDILHGGWYRNVEEKKRKFWYWFGLKHYFAYCWEMLKISPEPFYVDVNYVAYCPGCTRCNVSNKKTKSGEWRWWHILTGSPQYSSNGKTNPTSTASVSDYSNVQNENCGKREKITVKLTDFLIENVHQQTIKEEKNGKRGKFRLRIGGEGSKGRLGVIAEGWARAQNSGSSSLGTDISRKEGFYSLDVDVNSAQLVFDQLPPKCQTFSVSGEPLQVQNGQISIQSEIEPIELFLPIT